MPRQPLPDGTSVAHGASWVPCCDICGWIGLDTWTEGDARTGVFRHASGRQHRENIAPRHPPVGQSENLNVLPGGFFARILAEHRGGVS